MSLVPFKSLGTVSYSPSIVTMAILCIACEIQRLIGRKSRHFYTPSVFSAPPRTRWPRRNFVKISDAGKTRMIGLPYDEKTMTICYAVFIWYRNVTHKRTDRRTDGRTDRFAISISRVSMLTRDKKLVSVPIVSVYNRHWLMWSQCVILGLSRDALYWQIKMKI